MGADRYRYQKISGDEMNYELKFNDDVARKIWNNYFKRVDKSMRSIQKTKREELKLEIQGHLLESMEDASTDSDSSKLMDAIDRLGEPEDFIKPMIADKLLLDASKTFNPRNVFMGLFFNLHSSIKRAVLTMIISLGYCFLFCIAVMTIMKIIIPSHVGVFLPENGGITTVGILVNPGPHKEILGFWTIPIGVVCTALLYTGLTRLLRVFIKQGE